MAGDFAAVPDELVRAAKTITDTVHKAAELAWHGPSGDYGHPGVHDGWGSFMEEAKSEITKLAEATKGHGHGLEDVAKHYLELDKQAAETMTKLLGAEFGGAAGGIVGGAKGAISGFEHGGISGAISGAEHGAVSGAEHGAERGAAAAGHVSGWSGNLLGGGTGGSELGKEAQL